MYSAEQHHRAVEAQGRYTRRIGDVVALPNDDADGFHLWSIVDVVRGDDYAPVTLQEVGGTRIMTIPASRLHRFEVAMRRDSVEDNVAQVMWVDDIPTEKDTVPVQNTLRDVLERLQHRDLYTPDSIIASVFPQEIDQAVRTVFAA